MTGRSAGVAAAGVPKENSELDTSAAVLPPPENENVTGAGEAETEGAGDPKLNSGFFESVAVGGVLGGAPNENGASCCSLTFSETADVSPNEKPALNKGFGASVGAFVVKDKVDVSVLAKDFAPPVSNRLVVGAACKNGDGAEEEETAGVLLGFAPKGSKMLTFL